MIGLAQHAQTYGTFVDHVRTVGLGVVIVATIVVLPKVGRALLTRAWRPHTPVRVGRARRVVGNEPRARAATFAGGTPCPRSRRPEPLKARR